MVHTRSRNFLFYAASVLSATLVISVAAPASSAFADENTTYQIGQTVSGTGTTTTVLGDDSSLADPWAGFDLNNPVFGGSTVAEDDLPEITFTKSSDSYDDIYARLSDSDKLTFNEIVAERQLTPDEQLDLLQTWDGLSAQPRWKTAVLKWVVGTALSVAGISNNNVAAQILSSIEKQQNNLETALANALVKYAHVNKSVAKSAAKTAVFLLA